MHNFIAVAPFFSYFIQRAVRRYSLLLQQGIYLFFPAGLGIYGVPVFIFNIAVHDRFHITTERIIRALRFMVCSLWFVGMPPCTMQLVTCSPSPFSDFSVCLTLVPSPPGEGDLTVVHWVAHVLTYCANNLLMFGFRMFCFGIYVFFGSCLLVPGSSFSNSHSFALSVTKCFFATGKWASCSQPAFLAHIVPD